MKLGTKLLVLFSLFVFKLDFIYFVVCNDKNVVYPSLKLFFLGHGNNEILSGGTLISKMSLRSLYTNTRKMVQINKCDFNFSLIRFPLKLLNFPFVIFLFTLVMHLCHKVNFCHKVRFGWLFYNQSSVTGCLNHPTCQNYKENSRHCDT